MDSWEGITGGIDSVVFSPDGDIIAYSGGYWDYNNQAIVIWDYENQKVIRKYQLQSNNWNNIPYNHQIMELSFSPDSSLLTGLSTSEKGKEVVSLWNAQTGVHQRMLHSYNGTVMSIAWSPDGKKVAGAISDGSVLIWNVITGENVFSL